MIQLPTQIETFLEKKLQHLTHSDLKKSFQQLSSSYREKKRKDVSLFTSNIDRICYLTYRLPATFAACFSVLEKVVPYVHSEARKIYDFGGGAGFSYLAFASFFQRFTYECIEKDEGMIQIGKEFLGDKVLFTNKDVTSYQMQGIDIACFSYSWNELKEKEHMLQKLFKARPQLIIIIEPGSKIGYQNILEIREYGLNQKYHIVAPCPHFFSCPLQTPNWCHFSTRLPRSRLLRYLKEGTEGYEDEKFSYLVLSKEKIQIYGDRILQKPKHLKKQVKILLCTQKGEAQEKIITKSQKEEYKAIKKHTIGDLI